MPRTRRSIESKKWASEALSREGWVEAALNRLALDGIDKVQIVPLARELGITKGSFYWHFKDRQDLLDAMLDRWEGFGTLQIIEQVETEGGTPTDRLRRIVDLSIAQVGSRLEPAIRQWAQRDTRVHGALRRVDDRRLNYLRDLFGRVCDDAAEAEARSWLLYSLLAGVHLIAATPDHIEPKALLQSCLAVLTPAR